MRLEGQRRGRTAEAACARHRGADHRAMAAMHALEIADRDHRALAARPDAAATSSASLITTNGGAE